MFELFKKKEQKQLSLDPYELLNKATQDKNYPDRLRGVAEQTLKLNKDELPHVVELVEQLEGAKSVYEYPILMHNVVLLGRKSRTELNPALEGLLASLKKDVRTCKNEELRKEYYFAVKKLRQVAKKDTHPHIVYYDNSTFLVAFFSFVSQLGKPLTDYHLHTLETLHKTMLSIMRNTKKEKEETINLCSQMVTDLSSRDELGESK